MNNIVKPLKKIIIIKLIIILTYIFGILLVRYFQEQYSDEHAIVEIKAQMRGVQSALELYHIYNKSYPKDLNKIINKEYLSENSNKDLWGNEFYYLKLNENTYILISKGPDGIVNTQDDICPPIDTQKHLPENFKGKLNEIKWIGDRNRHLMTWVFIVFTLIIILFIVVYDLVFIIRNKNIEGFKKWNIISVCFTVALTAIITVAFIFKGK